MRLTQIHTLMAVISTVVLIWLWNTDFRVSAGLSMMFLYLVALLSAGMDENSKRQSIEEATEKLEAIQELIEASKELKSDADSAADKLRGDK